MSSPRNARPAFTLVELLAVIAMIGILAAILIPVVGSVMEQADTTKSTSNLRHLGSATALYIADNDYELPVKSPRGGNLGDPPWYVSLSDYIGITMKKNSNGFYEESKDNILRNPATKEEEKVVNYAPSISCATANGPLKLTDISEPSARAWLATTTQSYAYNPFLSPPLYIEYPHSGQANILYFDGRVALVPEEKVIDLGRKLLDPTAQ